MSFINKNPDFFREEEIPELPPLPETEVVPPGIITSHSEVVDGGVPDEDVELMREWNEENQL